MTDEVGVVTGDLEIATRLLNAGVFDVRVRYAGAEEWYTVAGSPSRPTAAALWPRSCTNTWWNI